MTLKSDCRGEGGYNLQSEVQGTGRILPAVRLKK